MPMGSTAELNVQNTTGDEERQTMTEEDLEAPSTSASKAEEVKGEDVPLGTGHICAFLLSGLLGIGLMFGAVVSCTFLTVAPGGLLISDDGAEFYRLGLFWSDAQTYGPTFDEDLGKNVWGVNTDSGGCLPYGQGGSAENYALYAPQQAARAFAVLSVGVATLLLMYHSCHLADLDGEGRRLCRPVLSSALFFLSGIAALLSLLFLDHTWCDEEFYGTCEMGWAAVLAILGGISHFACSGICWWISHSLVRGRKK